jgi:hypothetical protein
LIDHGPHWIDFAIFIFISEKNRYFNDLNFFGNKVMSFDMKKKKDIINVRQVMEKMKKNKI